MKMKKKYFIAILLTIVITIVMIYRSNNITSTIIIKIIEDQYFTTHFLIELSNDYCKKSPFIVILVTSYVGHVELRSAHRTAMPRKLLESLNIKRIFLLAKIPPTERYITQEAVKDESNIYDDILQGSFTEHYRNLTHKHLMGLQWAATSCKDSSFILKVDDDTVFSVEKTLELIEQYRYIAKDNFLMGYMLNNTIPRRNKQNKWYVTFDEYPRSEYPPYLSGWYYVTTTKVAKRLSEEAIYHPYFWIDDVFVTGILAEALNMELKHITISYWLNYYELLECCLRDMVKRAIKCEAVGPNGGRNNLLVEFNEAARNCGKRQNCTGRPVNKPLDKVCVAYKDRDIFSGGHAQIETVNL